MADDTVTVALEGPDITLASFAAAISTLDALLKALAKEVAKGSVLTWEVHSLEVGSAVATVLGRSISGDPDAPSRVRAAYETVGDALERGDPVPYSDEVGRHAQKLLSLPDDQIAAIRLETVNRDIMLTPRQELEAPPLPPEVPLISFGAVEGRIQTLTNRRSLRFILYDALDDRAVACYLKRGEEGMIQHLFDRRVIVEGEVSRDPWSGRPRTIRRITAVEPLPELADGDWREARGALARVWDGMPAEVAIRKIRDAW
jgi:hypothetical protein